MVKTVFVDAFLCENIKLHFKNFKFKTNLRLFKIKKKYSQKQLKIFPLCSLKLHLFTNLSEYLFNKNN